MLQGKCQMYANCQAAPHIRGKCKLHDVHDCCDEHLHGRPCPLGIWIGASDRVKCFRVKTETEKAA
jgi:hypothetical protein